jgi:flagellar biosynthesis chaperone FliJ
MSSWKKVKGLFWQPGSSAEAPPAPAGELSDAEFAEFLGASPHAVPSPAPGTLGGAQEGAWAPSPGAAGVSDIDFQAQYDAAGIPDTDEVEQLESFLSRLDESLPQASKLAAARAFLGAIGKSKEHVLEDAARKIQCVRSILAGKQEDARLGCESEQRQIDALQAEIEQHRQRMEELTRELEGVRHVCLEEEARLQAARVFFGNVQQLTPPGTLQQGNLEPPGG